MKLILLSRGGFDNPKSWSGTPFTIFNMLNKLGKKLTIVEAIDWQINKNILRIYHVIYGKLFFILGTARDPFLHFLFKRKITSVLKPKNQERNWILFIPDFCIPNSIDGKYKFSAYIDASAQDLFHYSDDNRISRKHFLSYYTKYDRLYVERMSILFTQNEWTRESVIEKYNIAPSKVVNVGFGINLKFLEAEKKYDENLLLIVLRKGTEKYKGLLLLLKAFEILHKNNPDVKLAVVGSDVGDNQPGVTCFYNQSREVTVDLFKKSTLYVMPALHEPNGITYLEALANKTPIVGLNRFAVPEFSGHGKWGFMAQNEDPKELAEVLNDALSDKKRLKEMGIKGQKFVMERYQWNVVVDKMMQAYKKFDSEVN